MKQFTLTEVKGGADLIVLTESSNFGYVEPILPGKPVP